MSDTRPERNRWLLIFDASMLGLIMVNLGWIFFDALFESESFRQLINWISPWLHDHYVPVHNDFLRYDLIFVSIYLTEISIRWVVAVVNKRYRAWYIFPLVHWYDILGCIPIGSFHLLRVLRIVVILKRLQDLGFIDWRSLALYASYKKYSTIVTEEISDRVVSQVLTGMSEELQRGTPVLHQIVQSALLPRKQLLSESISASMTRYINTGYDSRRTLIRSEINRLVTEAAGRSQQLKLLARVPMIGQTTSELLEQTITDMVFEITDQIVDYLRGDLSTTMIDEGLESLLSSLADPKSDVNHLVQDILLDSIDVIKRQVQIQRWKTEL